MNALRLLLQSFNIRIDPAEVEHAWMQAKDALPRIAVAFQEINTSQKRIELKLDLLLSRTGDSDGRTNSNHSAVTN